MRQPRGIKKNRLTKVKKDYLQQPIIAITKNKEEKKQGLLNKENKMGRKTTI